MDREINACIILVDVHFEVRSNMSFSIFSVYIDMEGKQRTSSGCACAISDCTLIEFVLILVVYLEVFLKTRIELFRIKIVSLNRFIQSERVPWVRERIHNQNNIIKFIVTIHDRLTHSQQIQRRRNRRQEKSKVVAIFRRWLQSKIL